MPVPWSIDCQKPFEHGLCLDCVGVAFKMLTLTLQDCVSQNWVGRAHQAEKGSCHPCQVETVPL